MEISSIVTVFPTRVYKFELTPTTDLLGVLCFGLLKSKLSTIDAAFHPYGRGQLGSNEKKIPSGCPSLVTLYN